MVGDGFSSIRSRSLRFVDCFRDGVVGQGSEKRVRRCEVWDIQRLLFIAVVETLLKHWVGLLREYSIVVFGGLVTIKVKVVLRHKMKELGFQILVNSAVSEISYTQLFALTRHILTSSNNKPRPGLEQRQDGMGAPLTLAGSPPEGAG